MVHVYVKLEIYTVEAEIFVEDLNFVSSNNQQN